MFAIQSLQPKITTEIEDEKPLMLKVCELNQHIVCILCAGYFVDATTITECLHTFCKSCVVKYLQTSKHCPMCNIKIHETQPLVNLRPDRTMQDIVFTLVPHLWKDEALRMREFYRSRGIGKVQRVKEVEVKKQVIPERTHQPTQDHLLSLCLERLSDNTSQEQTPSLQKKFVRCSVRTCIHHLQKLLKRKLNLQSTSRVDIFCNGHQLVQPDTTVKCIWLTHWFEKQSPMVLHFQTHSTVKPTKYNVGIARDVDSKCESTKTVHIPKKKQCQPTFGTLAMGTTGMLATSTPVALATGPLTTETFATVRNTRNSPLKGKHSVLENSRYRLSTGKIGKIAQLQEPTGKWKTIENTQYKPGIVKK